MFKCPEKYRVKLTNPAYEEETGNRLFIIARKEKMTLHIISSNELGWEHVSVSTKTRVPKWEEMAFVKSIFWDDQDTVIEYHVAKTDHINIYDRCLHLWRPIGIKLPCPPLWMV